MKLFFAASATINLGCAIYCIEVQDIIGLALSIVCFVVNVVLLTDGT